VINLQLVNFCTFLRLVLLWFSFFVIAAHCQVDSAIFMRPPVIRWIIILMENGHWMSCWCYFRFRSLLKWQRSLNTNILKSFRIWLSFKFWIWLFVLPAHSMSIFHQYNYSPYYWWPHEYCAIHLTMRSNYKKLNHNKTRRRNVQKLTNCRLITNISIKI
jgi:hypothetical protein